MGKDEIQNWTGTSGTFSTKGRARTKEQYADMAQAEKDNICPFCHPERWKNSPVVSTNHWIIKFNDFPYEDHQLHLLIVWKPSEHLEDIHSVPDEAWLDLYGLLNWVEIAFRLPAINFVMRFGDPDLRGSTIHHLHGHVQIPSEAVLLRESPLIYNWRMRGLIWHSKSFAIIPLNPAFHHKKFIILQHDEEKPNFYGLMTGVLGALGFILDQKIQSGGIVYRCGDRRYTNSKFIEPNITVYAPDGTGRVQATFIPPLPGKTKPVCKATFCKGFEGEELENLRRRMQEFRK